MKRLTVLAALVVAALAVVAGSALAAGVKTSVIYDSTAKNGPPSNLPSYGAEAYAFSSIGDTITFADGPRKLTNATVTLSSWGCVSGTWTGGNCVTPTGATFAEPITLTLIDPATSTTLATVTQTFNIPYRPSASPKCDGANAGKWYASGLKTCFNGFANDVTFNLNSVTVPSSVTYAISYNTSGYGPAPLGYSNTCNSTTAGCPYDSLNVAVTSDLPSTGSAAYTGFGGPFYTPAVQFKAGGGS